MEIYFQAEEGWLEISCNGKSGMFPSNFVEYLDEENDLQNSGEL